MDLIKNLTAKIEQLTKVVAPEAPSVAAGESPQKIALDFLACPYCGSAKYVKRGWRQKERERVQLLKCSGCGRTFTPHSTRGKHYPLLTVYDAISLYNLGHSLEETCERINRLDRIDVNKTDKTDRTNIQPSTVANWLEEFRVVTPFARMREYALRLCPEPKYMVVTATLAHRQLYRYRFHQVKCDLVIQEDIRHARFKCLKDFLQYVPVECPHQYFQTGQRASETPLTFSKEAMIVRGKTNYATTMCAFVLQGVTDRQQRHEALQKFLLYNDSVTVATEVPVYLTRDDVLHMQTQLGFEVFNKTDGVNKTDMTDRTNIPKLITGHVDFLQIRNGQVHILDYKPKAEKERPIEQLTLYAMALSRLTGLRLFDFKCAWFDEKDYFEFYPLHVLHKPSKARRRRKVLTQEGTYAVNKEPAKIKSIRPI